MDIYLVCADSPCRYALKGANIMDIYLAGAENWARYIMQVLPNPEKNPFKGTYLLQSYFYYTELTENLLIPSAKKFMLDSGAFTFMTQNKGVADWDKYLEGYAEFINKHNLDLFFELDIDSLVGYSKVKEYRRRLERLTGKPCIPVWHKSRGIDEFERMCQDYDYVSIGGIVSKEITRKEWRHFPYFIDMAHKKGAKIHGLGFTSIKDLPTYHFDSVDSTAWTSGNRFGTMYRFNGQSLDKFCRTETQRLANHKLTAYHNFTEWVKFQKYARRHL